MTMKRAVIIALLSLILITVQACGVPDTTSFSFSALLGQSVEYCDDNYEGIASCQSLPCINIVSQTMAGVYTSLSGAEVQGMAAKRQTIVHDEHFVGGLRHYVICSCGPPVAFPASLPLRH